MIQRNETTVQCNMSRNTLCTALCPMDNQNFHLTRIRSDLEI